MELRPSLPHLGVAALIFLVEAFIAAFVHDRWIRPFGGELLVVVLIHFFVRGTTTVSARAAAWGAFAFACLVETGQWLQLAQRLGLEQHWIGRLFLGTTFHWGDVLVYGVGALCAWALDRALTSRRPSG